MDIRISMVDGDFCEFETPLETQDELEDFAKGVFSQKRFITGIDQVTGTPVVLNPKYVKDIRVIR